MGDEAVEVAVVEEVAEVQSFWNTTITAAPIVEASADDRALEKTLGYEPMTANMLSSVVKEGLDAKNLKAVLPEAELPAGKTEGVDLAEDTSLTSSELSPNSQKIVSGSQKDDLVINAADMTPEEVQATIAEHLTLLTPKSPRIYFENLSTEASTHLANEFNIIGATDIRKTVVGETEFAFHGSMIDETARSAFVSNATLQTADVGAKLNVPAAEVAPQEPEAIQEGNFQPPQEQEIKAEKVNPLELMSVVWLTRQADHISDKVREECVGVDAEAHQALLEFATKHNAVDALIPSEFSKVKNGKIEIDYSKLPEEAKDEMIVTAKRSNPQVFDSFVNKDRNHTVAEVQAARSDLWDKFHDSKGIHAVKNGAVALVASIGLTAVQPFAFMIDKIENALDSAANGASRAGQAIGDGVDAVLNAPAQIANYVAESKVGRFVTNADAKDAMQAMKDRIAALEAQLAGNQNSTAMPVKDEGNFTQPSKAPEQVMGHTEPINKATPQPFDLRPDMAEALKKAADPNYKPASTGEGVNSTSPTPMAFNYSVVSANQGRG
jgi:hypothetical protein